MWPSAGGHFHLFLCSRRPSPCRAAGDLALTRAVPRTTPPCAGLWSQAWTYSPVQWVTSRVCPGLSRWGCVRPPRGDTSRLFLAPQAKRTGLLPSLQGTLRPTCWDIPCLLQSHPALPESSATREKTEASGASALREQTTEGQNRNKPSSPRSPQSGAFALPHGALPGPRTSSGAVSPSEARKHCLAWSRVALEVQ